MDVYAFVLNDKKLKLMLCKPKRFTTAVEGALLC